MKKYAIFTALAVTLLLAGCDDDRLRNLPPNTRLPPIPADIERCLAQHGVAIPPGRLTVGQVRRIMANDRRTIVAMRQCGSRLIAWYNRLRGQWR